MSEIDVPKPAVSRTSVLNAGFCFAHDRPGTLPCPRFRASTRRISLANSA